MVLDGYIPIEPVPTTADSLAGGLIAIYTDTAFRHLGLACWPRFRTERASRIVNRLAEPEVIEVTERDKVRRLMFLFARRHCGYALVRKNGCSAGLPPVILQSRMAAII